MRSATRILHPVLFLMIFTWMPSVLKAESKGSSQVVVGQARFTVITAHCIRLEFNPTSHFVDEPSYFALHRETRWNNAKIISDESSATIDTGFVRLIYKSDGKPFSRENLRASISNGKENFVDWHPGLTNGGNLGGTERTLDTWDGARKLSDGILSRDGWYLLDDSKTALFTTDWVKSRPQDAGLDWYLFAYGNDYKAALKSLTAVSGAVPLPRRYTLGAWYSRYWPYSSDEFRQIVQEYTDHDFPLDVLVMDMDWHLDGWTGYTWNPKLLSDHAELLDWVHAQGLAVTLNDHPADGVQRQEACYADFMRAMGKDPVSDKPLPFDAGDKKYLDTFYAFTHKPREKEGVDFWWLDWQQYPFTRSVAGLTNLAWLNHYNFQETASDGKRGVSFSRWGGWGSQRYPIQFSGDASTSFAMLAGEVPFTSTAGNVGCFFWSHDIGGHNRGRNEESYARWCQFGAFSTALRSHSTRDATMDRRPWMYPKWAEKSMHDSFQLRSRFFPYLYTAMQQACADSIPFIRPMYLDNPSTEEAYHQPQEYMFGDNILVAPITEAGTGDNLLGRQTVWFPPGQWYDFFTNERYQGSQQVLAAASIDQFPLYCRGGIPIPMRSFTRRMATDPISELVIRCYPGTNGQKASSTLYEDDGLTTAYQAGAKAQTTLTYSRNGSQVTITVSPTVGKFDGQLEQRSYLIELPSLAPATKILVDDTPASAEYAESESVNRIKVPATSIRQGFKVTVTADEISPELMKSRAFTHRLEIDNPSAGVNLTELISNALAHAQNDQQKSRICAAAGIGVFSRNENVYGYPARSTDRFFVPDGISAGIKLLAQSTNDLDARTSDSYKVTVGSQSFVESGGVNEVDWATRNGNIAGAAKVTVSSGGPAKALVDGRVDGYPGDRDAEWTTDGEKSGAWAKLEWPTPQTIDHVLLFDRRNLDDNVNAGQIEFSDGSFVSFGPLQNNAARATDVQFRHKTVTWFKINLNLVASATKNIGLAEVVVLKSPESQP